MPFKVKYWLPIVGIFFVDRELSHLIKGEITEQFPLWSMYQIVSFFIGVAFIAAYSKHQFGN